MNDKDITEKLTGQYVTIITKRWGQEDLVKRDGIITSLEPRLHINIEHSYGMGGHIMFAGFGEAIFQMKDREGKIIYQNDSVLEAYKHNVVESEEQQELRKKGIFTNPL